MAVPWQAVSLRIRQTGTLTAFQTPVPVSMRAYLLVKDIAICPLAQTWDWAIGAAITIRG